MRTETWTVWMAMLLLGCPAGDDGSAGTEGDTDASTGTPTSSSTSSTSATSMSSTSEGTSSSSSTTETADTSTSDVTGEVGPTTSDGSTSGSTGTPDACAGLGRDECNTDATCTAIMCSAYEETPQGATPWCVGDAMFIGCRSADLDCAMDPTITCEGDDAPIYRCREDCLPQGFDVCAPPVDGDVPSCEG